MKSFLGSTVGHNAIHAGTYNELTTTCSGAWSSSDQEPRPVIRTRRLAGGDRLSTVRRADGSTFTVLVPSWAVGDEHACAERSQAWIVEVGGPSRPSGESLRRLGAWVGLRIDQQLGIGPIENHEAPSLAFPERPTGRSRRR